MTLTSVSLSAEAALPRQRKETTGQRRRDPAASRKAILDAARVVFSRRGFFDATISEIVEGSGLARGTFYLYYADKDAVFEDLFKAVMTEMHLVVNRKESGTHRERVETAVRSYLTFFSEHRGILGCILQTVRFKPEFAKLHNEIRSLSLYRIEAHLVGNIERGFCNPVDPRITAYALGGLLEWMAYSQMSVEFHPWGRAFKLEDMVREITDIWCRAVYSDAAAALDPDSLRKEPEAILNAKKPGAAAKRLK